MYDNDVFILKQSTNDEQDRPLTEAEVLERVDASLLVMKRAVEDAKAQGWVAPPYLTD